MALGKRSAWIGPLKVIPKSLPKLPPARSIPKAGGLPPYIARGAPVTNIPVYDPSRIFKDIKVVKDLRQSGTERGETQTGDGGMLGPGSIGFESRYKTPGAPAKKGALGLTPLQMGMIAAGAFLLFGG